MIANTKELAFAARNLTILEQSLWALRGQLQASNPALLGVTSPASEQRIASIQSEIAPFISEHPVAVSLLLTPGLRDDTPEVVWASNV